MPRYRCQYVHASRRRLFESAITLILNRYLPATLICIFLGGISGLVVAANIEALPAKPAPGATMPVVGEKPATLSAPVVERTEGADKIYAAARPRLLQIRTLLTAAGRQSSLGSGFLVNAEGFAVTNYHVVSQYALEPATYRMEYAAPDGTKGPLKLLAIDVANDLAVVQLDKTDYPFFEFNPHAIDDTLPKGERLYAMGNPLDLGFTIVDGTYNSLVEKSYQERIHFTGALNPGMSGGPTVTRDGRIAGVNVAKQVGGELVSFLVPAKFAAALIERAKKEQNLPASLATTSSEKTRTEIGRQLSVWQATMYQEMHGQGFRSTNFGPYRAPEAVAPWFTCWARTNAEQVPKPRAIVNGTNCSTKTWLFIANSLQTGSIDISHSYSKGIDLNPFQFANFIGKQFDVGWMDSGKKHVTQNQCVENFVAGGAANASSAPGSMRPPLRVVWCARAMREYDNLYNVTMLAVTQDKSNEALISKLSMTGVAYDNALQIGKRFIAAITVASEASGNGNSTRTEASKSEVAK